MSDAQVRSEMTALRLIQQARDLLNEAAALTRYSDELLDAMECLPDEATVLRRIADARQFEDAA